MQSSIKKTKGELLKEQRELAAMAAESLATKQARELAYSIFSTKPGLRRAAILATLKAALKIPVDNKWQLSAHRDKDIQYLLKKGLVKKIRETHPRSKSQSYIVLA